MSEYLRRDCETDYPCTKKIKCEVNINPKQLLIMTYCLYIDC